MRTKSVVACLVGLVLLFASSSSSAAGMRKWTTTDGKEIKAEFVSWTPGKGIVLRQRDGKEITLRPPELVPEDRKYIRQMLNSQSNPEPKKGDDQKPAGATGRVAKKYNKDSPGEKESANQGTIEIFGRPKPLENNVRALYIWCDAQRWHVRSATKGVRHLFTGAIHVTGGKFTGIANASMETTDLVHVRSHVPDIGAVNPARDTIMFKFTTKGAQDGFDFAVDEAATELEFRILRDGAPIPNEIRIGAGAKRPPAAAFSLPAHPTKQRAKPDKEKKEKKNKKNK